MGHKILFIYDKEETTNSIPMDFGKQSFEIIFANGEEAIKELKAGDFAVVISDLKMLNVLKKAKELRPNAVRMSYSGYSKQEIVDDAVKGGLIWQFISDLSDNDKFKVKLKDGIEHYEKKVNLKEDTP